MAGDNEAALLATGHVKAELFLRRQSEEVSGKAGHVGNEVGTDTVVDNLENTPVLTGIDDFLAYLGSPAIDFIDTSKGDDGDFIAELVVGNFWTLVFVTNEAGLKGLLLRQSRESCRGHWGINRSLAAVLVV